MKKKRQITIEDMEKALRIEITPKEQKVLQKMSWEEMVSRAMKYNPNKKKKKGRK